MNRPRPLATTVAFATCPQGTLLLLQATRDSSRCERRKAGHMNVWTHHTLLAIRMQAGESVLQRAGR